jgi:uncharacterized damage-inducible protein DinB
LLFDYHYWATAQLLTACEALTPEQWEQPHGHSWASVHGVVAHMLAAEIIWLTRWQGTSPTVLLGAADFPALADVRRRWVEVESQVRAFIAECDDARLARPFSFSDTKGKPYVLPLGPVMMHVANHGTHHRGEVAAMLAQLNVPHPEDDMIRYIREQAVPSGG